MKPLLLRVACRVPVNDARFPAVVLRIVRPCLSVPQVMLDDADGKVREYAHRSTVALGSLVVTEVGAAYRDDVAVLQEVFSDFTVKQWTAKNTYFLMKVEIDAVMHLTSEFFEYMGAEGEMGEEAEMSIDSSLSFLAYNYNQPVSIVLPPEAKAANGK